ncbi:unnamed protein product, partial [Ixodes hexagonus]
MAFSPSWGGFQGLADAFPPTTSLQDSSLLDVQEEPTAAWGSSMGPAAGDRLYSPWNQPSPVQRNGSRSNGRALDDMVSQLVDEDQRPCARSTLEGGLGCSRAQEACSLELLNHRLSCLAVGSNTDQ